MIQDNSLISFLTSIDTLTITVLDPDFVRNEIQQEFKRARIQEISKQKGPSTRAFWKQEMSSDQYIMNCDLFQSFVAITNDQEKEYPLNKQLISDLLAMNTLKEEPTDKTLGTRVRFGEVIQDWEGVDITSRNTPSIGSKPDVLHRKVGRTGAQSIRVVGEVKDMEGSDDFSDKEQGHILDLLQITLNAQPWRQFIYGYLTDCKRFEFYRANRGETSDGKSRISFERSGLYFDVDGWKAMQLLILQDDATLGFNDVHVEGWELDTLLGTGATSAVFRATNQTTNAVCKLYFDVSCSSFQLKINECAALKKLESFPCIPKVVSGAPETSACGRFVLITTPVGLDIPQAIRLPLSAYAMIVLALQYAHANDIYHNDIAPDNLVGTKLPDQSLIALLIDFGSACGQSTIQRRFYSIGTRALFYCNKEYKFGAKADLCALVRSIFFLTQDTFARATPETAEDLDAIIDQQIWYWKDAMTLAKAVNYEGLYNHLVNGGKSSLGGQEK